MPDATAPAPEPPRTLGARLRPLVRMRATRAQVVVALLCGLLGFALVTQVHSTERSQGLAAARPEDLIGILNDLSARGQRLRAQIDELEATQAKLQSGTGRQQAALDDARQRAETLGIVAGTIAAQGPGIVLTVDDPQGRVRADVLLDALEELRDAGAEAVQIGDVRAVASTYLVDGDRGGILVDGRALRAPYRFTVVGDPKTLSAALAIPGGVVDTVAAQGGGAQAVITTSDHLVVSALRAADGGQ